ncbi:MAG TPA: hypothetical protein VNE60_04920, partial [Gemmatimonadaceae bacterium]|nr:hypothetical protein [Gemmatimonadaceae bacterium]
LQHGSILLADDQALIGELLRQRRPTVTPPAASLDVVLGQAPPFARVADALVSALRALSPDAGPLDADEQLQREVAAATGEFADERWTWRR